MEITTKGQKKAGYSYEEALVAAKGSGEGLTDRMTFEQDLGSKG